CYMEDDHEDGAIDLGASPTMMEIMPVDDGDHVHALEIKIKGAKTKGPYHITYELHHLVMIGCDRFNKYIQRVQDSFAHADTKVALTSLACTDMVSEHVIPKDMASPINFNQFLEKEKLKSNGSNFTDWFRHVRIFLNGGNLQYVLDAPLGDPPAETETDEVKNVYATRKTRYSQVQCAILCSLESDLQKRFEHHDPHELIKELKTIFETHAAVECYEASKHFFSCMMEEGSSISEHMLVMTGHAKKLSDLGIVIPNRLGINRVLQSLPPSYKNFVMNYNMQNMNKEFPELFGMLKAAEIEIKKEHQVLMVNKTTSFKKQGKSKGKNKKSGKKAATPPVKPKSGPKPDAECYYCKEKGHWKRNCSKYLADLKSGLIKKKKEGISDIHVIDVYLTSSRSSTWVFDTGSVAHICNSKQELKNKRQLLKDEVTMRVGNGSKVNVIAVGTLPLHLPSGLVLSLNNCYYVPALSMNIISGSCLMQDGYSFKSENNGCSIFMNNIFYGRAPQKNGLFLLDLDSSNTHIHNIDAKRIKLNDNSTYMWHCRLGHIGVKRMKKLHTDGLLESLDFESLDRCEACLMGKMTKTPFSGMMERATDLLEIIHTDVCGPMSVASRGGYRYVLTFTDDLSRYGYIYLMKHKSETFEKFKEFQSEVENQRNKKIKFLRSDRGGEYLSYEFSMHLKKCGILSQLTPPGTPQRNGVSERRNRTLLDMVRSMMSLTDLPLSFWSYALETAAFTLNRAPSKSVETTPYELWFNKKPKLSFLKVWGCEAYVKKLQPDKLEPKAEKCVFIGYPKETIGYTFYHRSEGKIFVAKNGTFLEKEFLTKEVTGRKVELDEIEESLLVDQSSAVPENVPVPPTPTTEEANDNDHETSNETATEPRRSTRDRATPDWYDPCLNVMIVDNNDEDPATYEEAMMSPDSNKWQEAMKSEMGSMYDNKVWTLVDLPDSRKAVENKWIFKRKTDADGNITVYKARLVAKGFRQIQGVDYDETFSPVAKLKSVRILLAIAAFFDYEIWQMDVKTAFLNGDIEEELYMVQPKGFVDPKNADKVCKLQRSIYGLKQASRSWNRRFDKVIKDFGFIQCHGEACIYKKVSGSSVAFLILYVDDILLIGNDIELLSSVKGYLNNSFSMKDLGEASYILGIKIYRDRSRRLIGLSQSTYLDKILKKFRMDESKKGFLPMLPGKVLSKTQGPATAEERERMSQIPYASAVGSIMYAMLCTRPDIAHAVSLTSRYQSDPGMEHWTAVKNILKYLKRTKDMFLCYGGDQELVVTSYTDASWNTDPDDSKSQSGYVFILNGAAVSWASSKQCTVAKSSTESEYIAASEASSEAVWMKRFIVELGVVPSALDPFVIYCDNMGAIANAQEPRSHKRLKHIKLRYHSIREYIEDGEVKICKVHTDLNVADPLTKALPRAKHDQHQNAMGVRKFEMSMMGELKFFLGFQVRQLAKGTFISQEKYVKDMLKKFNMTNASPMKTPMPVKGQLGSCDGEKDVDIKIVGVVKNVALLPREEGLRCLHPAVLAPACLLKHLRLLTLTAPLGEEARQLATYTGGDSLFCTKTQASLWEDFYNTRDCMKNGVVVMPKAINPDELELHEATKYRFVVETLKGLGLYDLVCLKPDDDQIEGTYCPLLICQFHCTVFFHDDDDRTMTWMTGKGKYSCTYTQFCEAMGFSGRRAQGFRIHSRPKMTKGDISFCYPPNPTAGPPTISGMYYSYLVLAKMFRESLISKPGDSSEVRNYHLNLMYYCHPDNIRQIDGCDLLHCELKHSVIGRMTPNYAQYVQRLINKVVLPPNNTLDQRITMEPFKFPNQDTRPDVPAMMPSKRRSKERHDPAARPSYSRRSKRGASRFLSSLWQMCKNTNDVAHQSLALN
ncbi:hypothetical protein QYE76_035869, partial [Lolium multiflorum]